MIRRTAQSRPTRPLQRFWILFGMSLAVFLPFVANGFFSDDYDVISHLAAGGPLGMWSHPPTSFFRPIVASTLWCCYAVGGWQSWVFALPNYLLNAVNAGLVFLVARGFLSRYGPGIGTQTQLAASALAALIFVVAPGNLEAIVFISDRGDLLSALFSLSAVLAFLSAIEKQSSWFAIAAVGLIGLGCLSKESIYAMFLFFAAMALIERKDKARTKLAWSASLGSLVVALLALAVRSRVVTAALPYGAESRMAVEVTKSFARLGMMLARPAAPVDFGILLGRSHARVGLLDGGLLVLLLVLVGLTTARLIRSPSGAVSRLPLLPPLAAFAASGAAVCFLSMKLVSPEGGRLMYPPSAYASIAIAFAVTPMLSRKYVRAVVVAFILCGVYFTYLSCLLYRSVGNVCATSLKWFTVNRRGPGAAVILVPDSAGGRYIWRNGFAEALRSFAPDWAESPEISMPYLDEAQVRGMIRSGRMDLDSIKIGEVSQSRRPPTEGGAVRADLVVVWEDGSVQEIRGVDVALPEGHVR